MFYNANESAAAAGDLAFHILYHDLDKLDRNEAEDKIACDILSYHLPVLTQYEVNLAFDLVSDLRKEYN
jgi:hypothetical protein